MKLREELLSLIKVDESYIDIIFEWANESDTRKNAFHTDIIDYENHKKWFFNKLNDDRCIFLICKQREINIGQIRIDIENNKGIISYSVDKKYRGLGYGKKLIEMAEIYILENSIDCEYLIGRVKKDNFFSQRCFVQNNYTKILRKKYIEYSKKIDKF